MNLNVTVDDKLIVGRVRNVLLSVLKIPADQLEHAVQVAHESGEDEFEPPPEVFLNQGVTRQALRMFWHFRCNLEAVMPPEARR